MALQTIKTIDISGIDNDPNGLAFDGKNLWMAGTQRRTIFCIDRLGNLITSFAMPFLNIPAGITFDGKNLWVGDDTTKDLIQFDRTGKEISRFTSLETPQGLTFDGKNLWITQSESQPAYYHIDQYDRLGNLISGFDISITTTSAADITTNGKNLFFPGTSDAAIYQFDKLGNLIDTYNVAATDTAPTGITFDGVYLWWLGIQNNILVQSAFA